MFCNFMNQKALLRVENREETTIISSYVLRKSNVSSMTFSHTISFSEMQSHCFITHCSPANSKANARMSILLSFELSVILND